MGHSRSQGYAGPCGLRVSLPYTLLGKAFGHHGEVFACQSPSTTSPGRVTGHNDSVPFHSEEPVEPQAEAKFRMDLMPRLSGLQKLMVDFESDQLTGVKGFRNVIIAPQPM
ncbi:hypothetical protein DUI87_27826 [Hirundo rustica rustica]|uniref:Transglutaminase C-terminal domain-containing protein n=1 Tax=Hirundo rustica rustica TaxID=333673 RepID=A0A3M0J9Z6_HIRRU|nr:hypothetical protein DUI87_27826 [Hirundo rustica rustica]